MQPSSLPASSRGSALAVTIIFTMVCALLAFAVLKWSVTERRLNSRAALWLAARSATEGIAEYGFSQVRNDFDTKSTPGIYKPGTSNALNLPNASVFSGGTVVTSAWNASTNPNGWELIGGPVQQIPSGSGQYYVDPTDYNNQFDPLKGKWVYRQDVQIIARASVTASTGAPITHYVTETISIRGAPLFAHAIFYNGDLELDPGPQMDVYGPVHTNGNLFVSNQSSSGGLNFHGPVTAVGNVYHAWSSTSTAAQGSGSETLGQNPVTFVNAAGSQVNMKASTATSSWKDSTMGASYGVSGTANLAALVTSTVSTSFRQYAAATWGGNLQTGANGIMPYNPVSFNQVIDAAGNHPDPSVIIAAPATPVATDPYYTAKMEVEAQKKSMQAGLYIKVAIDATGAASVSFFGPPNSAPAGTPAAQIGPNGGLLLNPPANVANSPSAGTNPPIVSYLPFKRLRKTVGSKSGGSYPITYSVLNADGTTDTARSLAATTSLPSSASSATVGTTYTVYSDSTTGSFGYGMYDQRRGGRTDYTTTATLSSSAQIGAIDLVQIDMRAVTALVTAMKNPSTLITDPNVLTYVDPADHLTKVWNNDNAVASGLVSSTQTVGAEKTPWNGAVYIDVQTPMTNTTPSSQTTSVRLVNGTVANGSSLIPSYGANGIGLSLATNAPIYVLGHFNADGTVAANNYNTPDDGKDGSSGNASKESPTALAADCITILSPGWSDASSLTLKPNATGNVEIAAAFLVGNVATGGVFSGGAHNLPRFLEDWSGDTVDIRGSLVTLFNCKVGTQGWSTAYYGAPNRAWGFDVLFQNGNYPPFTPKVMSYRRVDFADLTAAQYAAKKAAFWP